MRPVLAGELASGLHATDRLNRDLGLERGTGTLKGFVDMDARSPQGQ